MGACSSSSSSESPEGEAEAPKKKEIVLKSRSATPSASELMARMKMSSCPNIDLASKMVAKGDLNFVRTFVEAWPTTAYEYAPILVDIAANERKYKIWQLFIDESICEVSWKRPSGYSPLMEAIFAADVEMVDFLMKAGADVNELYLDNWTTLMLAVKERQPDIVEALVKHKRDGDPVKNIDDRSYPDGWTALLLAANLDEKEEIKCKMIDILLDAGANPNLIYCGAIDEEAETDEEDREGESEGKNSKDEKGGLTALHIAAMKGEASICKALVRAGADVTMVGKDDNTSLHYACINGNVEVAKILIGACKSETLEEFINMRSNRDGWTGLHFCAKLGHSQIGLELMNCNADTNIKSIENGMSPYALAKASNSSLLLHIITPAMDDIMRDSSIVISPSTQLSSKAPPRNSVKSVSEAPRETRSETSTAPHPEVTEATVEVETLGDRHSVPSSIRPSGEAPSRNPLKSVSEAPIEGQSKISAAPQSEVTEAEAPSLGASPVGFENSTFENTSNLGHDPIPSEQISEDDEEAHILPETTGTGASPPSQPSPMDKVGPKLKKGFMMKQGDWLKDERKRWFVLERGRLCYYLKASTYPPYGEEKKGEMIIDESVGIYTLERPPTSQGDRDSRSSDRGSSFMTMRETFTSSTVRNSVNRRVCKTDKQILIIRKIGGQDDADLFVCQSREERNEWVLALESHKYSNSV